MGRMPTVPDGRVEAMLADLMRRLDAAERAILKRPFLYLQGSNAGQYSITSTTPALIDSTNLQGSLVCSGRRPVRVTFSATLVSPAGQSMRGGVRLDSTDQDGRLWFADLATNQHVSGFQVFPNLAAGSHTFAVTAFVTGGTGVIYNDTAPPATDGNRVRVLVEEL